jgi:hypothetical protein
MRSIPRIGIMIEMHGRDMLRRHIALALLVALPLAFYLTSAGNGTDALPTGGTSIAFAVGGATLFSALSSAEVDQRLVMGGYRPIELLLGRVLFLGPLGLALAAAFSVLMVAIAHPERPWLLGIGVALVALQSVPLGLAIAALVPRELEGTLVLIGIVGIQLAVHTDSVVAKVLPYYGPRHLIDVSVSGSGAILLPLLTTAAYGLGLFVVARLAGGHRFTVRQHPRPSALDDGSA